MEISLGLNSRLNTGTKGVVWELNYLTNWKTSCNHLGTKSSVWEPQTMVLRQELNHWELNFTTKFGTKQVG